MLTKLVQRPETVSVTVRPMEVKGRDRKGRVLFEGLSKGLIYEHADQWVN